jgi:hypothetical protein
VSELEGELLLPSITVKSQILRGSITPERKTKRASDAIMKRASDATTKRAIQSNHEPKVEEKEVFS